MPTWHSRSPTTATCLKRANDAEDLLREQRREAEARFVHQHQRRPRQQRAADRQHLLLPARQQARLLPGALLENRK